MKHALAIKNLTVAFGQRKILSQVSLTIKSEEIQAMMGPNGSGKSTLSLALAGHPSYTINNRSSVRLDQHNLLGLKPEERARLGLFVGFQQPIAIPGVRVLNFLRLAKSNIDKVSKKNKKIGSILEFKNRLTQTARRLTLDPELLRRSLNDGFSGGEKKKMEMLQALTLKPRFAIFDEIDTGLDIDALKIVANVINYLAQNGTGVLIITHYQRILKYLNPTKIYLLINGEIAKVGSAKLALQLEEKGYEQFLKK